MNMLIPKTKPIRNKAHLEFVRTLPCIACFALPSQAAHVRSAKNSGMGVKPGDDKILPCCAECHARQHSIGQPRFFGDVNRALELANVLWLMTGDRERCVSQILNYRKKAL